MFKPGEIAGVKGSEGRKVTILPISRVEVARLVEVKWPVKTSDGVFDESDLFPAHPTVLATAEGRDWSTEDYFARIRANNDAKNVENEGIDFKVRDQIEKVLKKAAVDLNGHWRSGNDISNDFKILGHLFLKQHTMSKQDAEDFLRAAESETPMDRWVPVDLGLSLNGLRTCSCCGEEDFETETNGFTVRLMGEPCKFPRGLPPTEWELNVPSGKLVVANDLRGLFPLSEDEDRTEGGVGMRLTALAYAAIGMSHAFVGNTCPGVYRCKDGTFKIAKPPSDDEYDEKKKKWVKIVPAPEFDGESIAGICTDLWWYSICDHAEFKKRCKRFKSKVADFDVKTVDVKPGVYRFRHDEEAHKHERPGECVYTRFEWVRDPDPVQDFIASYEQADVNPHAYVQAQVAKWPTLYGKTDDPRGVGKDKTVPWSDMTKTDRVRSWQRVADHIFFTIGGGTDWHEKGFPTAKIDPSVPDTDPPAFRAQYHWYPFSERYGGMWQGTLTSSFAKLLFRALESVISFGTTVHDNLKSREVHYVRERMLVAMKHYRKLAKAYPDQADPEYVAWLSQKGRAEAWVEKFPLGPEFTEKHAKIAQRQRWVPEDTYAVVFDARKLKGGDRHHFAWHPKKGGCWASKENADRYALNEWTDNKQPDPHNCFWSSHATNTSVPLYSVARVVKVGEVSHMGETLVEIAYDYGTPWMKDPKKRKALAEEPEKAGIQTLTKEEYKAFLLMAIEYFEVTEERVKLEVKSKNATA